MSVNQVLTWSDYPAPRVKKVKGKYSIVVSVPRAIRHLFGTPEIAKATGTIDRAIAEKKLILFGNELYAKLDQKQLEAEQDTLTEVDGYAVRAINQVAKVFSYNRGNTPALEPSTDFVALQKLKSTLDTYVQMKRDDEPAQTARANEARRIRLEGEKAGVVGLSHHPDEEGNYPSWDAPKSEETKEWLEKIKAARNFDADLFSGKKLGLLQTYQNPVVESFWRDLLTEAAQEQGLPSPVFEDVAGIEHVKFSNGNMIPKRFFDLMAKAAAQEDDAPLPEYELVERQRQVLPAKPKTVSSVMDEYLERVLRDHDIVDTQKKLKRWAHQFLDVMGDLEIAEIKPKHAYEYCDKILEQYPSRKNTTLKDYCWGVQVLLKHCVERDYIQSNPFRDLDLSRLGEVSDAWEPYERSELKSIFAYDWSAQDRLLLSLCATTGMRPTEVGNLTWERFNDTEHEGIRYFSTKDTATEKVRVKNRGSARLIPIHSEVELPPKAIGRLFDYEKDADGRCGTDIGHKVNHVLNRIVLHPRKSTRSFRKTFKQMMRDAKVEEEVHDFITGHSQGSSASRKNYGGMGIEVMFEAVSKLDVAFLKG